MSTTNYKQIEIEIRELVQSVRKDIYKIATRLSKLYDESDSYAAAIGIKPDDVLEYLNGFLQDFAVDLRTLRVILKRRPNEEQWDKPLRDLLVEVETEIKKEADDEAASVPRKTRHSAKNADLIAAERTIAEKDIEIERVKSEDQRLIAARDLENERLRTENERLRSELQRIKELDERKTEKIATLQGQIAELRRQRREPVPA